MLNYTLTFPKRKNMYRALFPKGSVGVEVGVLEAENATTLFKVVQPEKLHLVDLWSTDIFGNYCKPNKPIPTNFDKQFWDESYEAALPRIKVMGDVAEVHRGLSVEVAATFPDESLDWVYVDAWHTCDALTGDFQAWFPKLKHEGVFSGHDYTGCPPKCHLYHFHGIKKAVHEMLSKKKCRGWGVGGFCSLIGFTNREHYRSFALRIHKKPEWSKSP